MLFWLLAVLATYIITTPSLVFSSELPQAAHNARAAYISIDKLHSSTVIARIEDLLATTEINAVVIDFKVGKPVLDDHMKKLIVRFKSKGAYVIGRQVVFQDSYLASVRPDLALRIPAKNYCNFAAGSFWYSGEKSWNRYWVDMSSRDAQNYNIKIAKDGIDAGFDEINFDYIRFPSDGPGCKIADSQGKKKRLSVPPVYPVWNDKISKEQILADFFEKMNKELKQHKPQAVLSIDIYGYVFLRGVEPGVAQNLLVVAKYFDVVSPMAYPSHYACNEFGVKDPNTAPYKVYAETLKRGVEILKNADANVIVRPWIQDFSIASIYGCGKKIEYGPNKVAAEINASKDLGILGFMLWDSSNNYTKNALRPK